MTSPVRRHQGAYLAGFDETLWLGNNDMVLGSLVKDFAEKRHGSRARHVFTQLIENEEISSMQKYNIL